MKVYFATDHAGYELKNELLVYVRDDLGHEVEDCGAHEFDPEDDYPYFIKIAAQKVSEDSESRAIILGGSGQGEAVVANKFPGVRVTVYYGGPLEIVELGRTHNDANVLSLGARFVEPGEAKKAVQLWLGSEFSNEERHARRLAAIDT